MKREAVRRGTFVGALATCTFLWLLRPWHQRWGATDDEVRRPMPGDEEVPTPTVQSTRAITIDAPPQDVWPWIAQIGYVGYGRAGWYAFDFWDADAGRGRSSWRLHPEAQRLEVGLLIGEEGVQGSVVRGEAAPRPRLSQPARRVGPEGGAVAEVWRLRLLVHLGADERRRHATDHPDAVHARRARATPALVAVLRSRRLPTAT